MFGLPKDDVARKDLGKRIDEARLDLGMTFAQLGAAAGYDETTVRNVTKGRTTKAATLKDICKAVGVDLSANRQMMELADDIHGGYTKKSFIKYVGNYWGYRWSYQDDLWIIRSSFELYWSDSKGCLAFKEIQKYTDSRGRSIDFSQEGDVYSGDAAGLLHLMTAASGEIRLITVTKSGINDEAMRGAVLTQSRAGLCRPAVSPFLLIRKTEFNGGLSLASEMEPGSSGHAEIADALRDVEREIVHSTFGTGVISSLQAGIKPVPQRAGQQSKGNPNTSRASGTVTRL